MQIQVNTDHNINGDERLIEITEGIVKRTLKNISSRLTRTEVHIKDIRGPKGGEDIEVVIESRPEGLRPYAVHQRGTDIKPTVLMAAKKMKSRLGHIIDKRKNKHPH